MEQSGIVPAAAAISVSKPDRGRIAPRMELLSCAIHVPGSIRSHVVAVGLGIILSSHQCLLMQEAANENEVAPAPDEEPEELLEEGDQCRACGELIKKDLGCHRSCWGGLMRKGQNCRFRPEVHYCKAIEKKPEMLLSMSRTLWVA